MKRLFLLLTFVFSLLAFNSKAQQAWYRLGSVDALQVNGPTEIICSDIFNNIYATIYTDSSGFRRFNVAKWDGDAFAWNVLGGDTNALNANRAIITLYSDKYGNIYAAGDFTDSMYNGLPVGGCFVAEWNGSTWTELGTGINALNANLSINTICIDDSGNVYAAGNFFNILGYQYVAKWNGTTWSELGVLNANLFINSICVDDSLNVYAAGNFTDRWGHAYVAKYEPSINSWSEMGDGFDSLTFNDVYIHSIAINTLNNVYVSAVFEDSSGNTFSKVYEWSATHWSQLGFWAANNTIATICLGDSGFVYASGSFTDSIGNIYVAKWDPTTGQWSILGSDFDSVGYIASLCVDGYDYVYAGILPTSADNYVTRFGPPLAVSAINDNASKIIAYPNPTNNNIYIAITDPAQIGCEYFLYDCLGQLCISGKIQNEHTTLNVNNLPSGIYFLQVGTQQDHTFKIIKN